MTSGDPHARDPHYRRLRAIVDALPETAEKRPWGDEPHWTVAGKIFCGWSRGPDGVSAIGVKLEKPMQAMLVANDPRFKVAKYVGAHGWVDMDLGASPDWGEVEALVLGSYQLIAPRKLATQVTARIAASAATRARPPAPRAAKPVARPTARPAARPAKPSSKPAPKRGAKSASATSTRAAARPAPARRTAAKSTRRAAGSSSVARPPARARTRR